MVTVTHSVCVAKANNTVHDVAELKLMSLDEYRRLSPNAAVSDKIDHKKDAAAINNFLKEHLPYETLRILRNML